MNEIDDISKFDICEVPRDIYVMAHGGVLSVDGCLV